MGNDEDVNENQPFLSSKDDENMDPSASAVAEDPPVLHPYEWVCNLLAWAGIFIEFLAQCLYSALEGDVPTELITSLEFVAAILLTVDVLIRAITWRDFFYKKSPIDSFLQDEEGTVMDDERYRKILWWHKIKYVPNVPNYFDIIAGPGSLIIDIITFAVEGELNQVGSFMRIFRVVTLPGVRNILQTSFRALPKLLSTLLGSICLLFMFAFIAKFWFHDEFPDQFGNVVKSLFEVFVVATLDQWSGITRDVWEVYPHSWIFFVVAVLLFGFIMLNIFMGVVLGAFLDSDKNEQIASWHHTNTIRWQIHSIRNCVNLQRCTFSTRMTILEKRLSVLKTKLQERAQEEAEM